MSKSVEPETVTITRVCNASIEAVFDAWINPNIMKHWWTPNADWQVGEIEVDARPGGRFTVEFTPPGEGSFFEIGTYLEFEPPNRIVYTEHVLQDGKTMHGPEPCTVTFRSSGPDRTEVTVTSTLDKGDDPEPRKQGWSTSLDLLVGTIARLYQ